MGFWESVEEIEFLCERLREVEKGKDSGRLVDCLHRHDVAVKKRVSESTRTGVPIEDVGHGVKRCVDARFPELRVVLVDGGAK